MVRPVSGRIHPRGAEQAHRESKLSLDQKHAAREILSQYDPETITDEDKEALREELFNAGVTPGEDLKEIFDEEGFDVGKPPKKPRPQVHRSPIRPPARATSLSESARGELLGFLEKHAEGTVTREDLNNLSNALKTEGAPSVGWLIDIRL